MESASAVRVRFGFDQLAVADDRVLAWGGDVLFACGLVARKIEGWEPVACVFGFVLGPDLFAVRHLALFIVVRRYKIDTLFRLGRILKPDRYDLTRPVRTIEPDDDLIIGRFVF